MICRLWIWQTPDIPSHAWDTWCVKHASLRCWSCVHYSSDIEGRDIPICLPYMQILLAKICWVDNRSKRMAFICFPLNTYTHNDVEWVADSWFFFRCRLRTGATNGRSCYLGNPEHLPLFRQWVTRPHVYVLTLLLPPSPYPKFSQWAVAAVLRPWVATLFSSLRFHEFFIGAKFRGEVKVGIHTCMFKRVRTRMLENLGGAN